jgi:amino acid adenylation domain-containing protein
MFELSGKKRELLALLLEKEGVKLSQSITRRTDRRSPAPLSFAQQRLWFLQQLDPSSNAYNIPQGLRLSGALKVEVLRRSLSEVVRRHEALRTTFTVIESEPAQVIGEPGQLELALTDLREWSPSEREAEVQRLAVEEAGAPFDLARGPLFRVRLLRLAEQEHVLLFTLHHIVSDEWSKGILIREVSALYTAFAHDQPSPLPELEVQYADFTYWQREWLQGEELAAQLAYWKRQLGGELPLLHLPLDRPRPPMQTFRGAVSSIAVSERVGQSLKDLVRQEDATLFIALLAAFKYLLYRYTGERDILVGSPVAGRNRAEIEGLIGFFVNTLVLRTELAGNPTYRELLRSVRRTALGAYAHQDLPFEMLVRELEPERSLSHTPFFQVAFILRDAPKESLQLPGIELRALNAGSEAAKFDLTLIVHDTGRELNALISYNPDLFDSTTIERMLGHFRQLLEGIVANPDRRLTELELLTAAERRLLLVEWNKTSAEFPPAVCAPQLFEAQAARTPDATALLFADEQITYRELNRRANQLAHYLRSLGVTTDIPVGLCVERSVELVVGLLGIWKAGGVYVPLDPQYPAARLAFMMADTAMTVLVTEQRLAGSLPPHEAKVVCVDADQELIAGQPTGELESVPRPEQLAYIIYTSGSTGQPKGVLVEHRHLANTLFASQKAFDFKDTDIMPCLASFSFDIFLFELLNPLLVGGTSLLMSGLDVLDGAVAARMLDSITCLHAVPGLMRQLLGAAGGDGAKRREQVRQIFVGGDAVSPELLRELEQAFPCAHIHVLYGPTEAAIICAQYALTRGRRVEHQMIGQPLGNVVLRIQNETGTLVPIGVAGELYIAGAGVVRGYLNQPELMAEKFVVVEGIRFYRSGDIARYLPDGNIAFVGRLDQQVKVRGFRVELDEVRNAIAAHEAVRDVVVAARADDTGDKRLIAYIVAHADPALSVNKLRNGLKERLPEYMVPSAFVLLDEIPLTPNGKVNHRALPEVESARLEGEREYAAPRTATEEVVAAIWANVLGLQRVSLFDNFFDLGGHSLLATKVVSQTKQTFKLEVPLRAIFESPTVRQFAEVVESLQRAAHHLEEMPIGRVSREGELPLSFAQQRLWFHDQLMPENPAYNISAAVRLKGELSIASVEQTLEEIIRRHESLRTTFNLVGWKAVQVIAPALPLPLTKIDLRDLPSVEREAETIRRATDEARAPFDLARGPLLRVALVRLAEDEHVLVLTMHHIISDGWSMGVLISEFAALYAAFVAGQPSPLPGLPIQYADYAYWQREWLQGKVLETQLAYWHEQLATNFTELTLPLDRPRPALQSFRGAYQNFTLPKELSDSLKELSRREGVTLFMLTLGVFKVLLHDYSGSTDIVVGTDVANRHRVETEGLIGFFANQLVLRTSLEGDPTFSELLTRLREVALGAYAHQDLPFDKVVEALRPERDLSRNPLFQVMFGFKNAPMSDLALPGLSLAGLPLQDGTAVFDLSVYLTDARHGLTGLVRYSTDIFESSTIARMWQRYETLLGHAVTHPSAKLSELRAMLEESERKRRSATEKELVEKRRQIFKNVRRKAYGEASG